MFREHVRENVKKHPSARKRERFLTNARKTPGRLDQRRINNEIEFHLTDSARIPDEAKPCTTIVSLIILKSKQNHRSPITHLLTSKRETSTNDSVFKTMVLVTTPTEDEIIDW